jgi:hypothetical protein
MMKWSSSVIDHSKNYYCYIPLRASYLTHPWKQASASGFEAVQDGCLGYPLPWNIPRAGCRISKRLTLQKDRQAKQCRSAGDGCTARLGFLALGGMAAMKSFCSPRPKALLLPLIWVVPASTPLRPFIPDHTPGLSTKSSRRIQPIRRQTQYWKDIDVFGPRGSPSTCFATFYRGKEEDGNA